MQDGNWCHVLTLLDADTRYLLRVEPMLDRNGDNVEKVLDSAFRSLACPRRCARTTGPHLPRPALGGCRGSPSGGSSSVSNSSGSSPASRNRTAPSSAATSPSKRPSPHRRRTSSSNGAPSARGGAATTPSRPPQPPGA